MCFASFFSDKNLCFVLLSPNCSSSYAPQIPENSIQPLTKSDHNSDSPGNHSSYSQPNQSPEILMTLECNGNRTSVVTPIIEKQTQQSQQTSQTSNSTQQMTAAQTPPTDQHMNRTNWEPLTPPQ